MKKVLVLRLGALGDIVHTTIIARAIKEAHPDWEVHYCSEARYTHVLENNSDIDKIIPFDHKRKKDFSYNLEVALSLRHEHYDVIFNLTNAFRNNFMTFIAQPKRKFGKVPMGDNHVVEAFFMSAKNAFPELELPKNLKLGVSKNVLADVQTKVEKYPRPYIIFSPGGQTDNNRQGRSWTPENWIELGKKLNGTIFISGSPDERKYHKTIADKIKGAVLMSGELSISESMALFSLCDLFISGDSGPLHIASGLGVNCVGIFGSTNPKNVRPYGEKGYIVEPTTECRYCWEKKCKLLEAGEHYTPCMKSITPEMVLKIIEEKDLL